MSTQKLSAATAITSAPLCGYIEGYYGRLLTWPERLRLLDKLQQRGMNSYFYAPKEDEKHRLNWREPYDADWLAALKQFCVDAAARHIRVIAGIAPGLDFDFREVDTGADFRHLLDKARTLLAAGATDIALLMDDIDEDFSTRCGDYGSEGEAHAALTNKLANKLEQPVFFVPRAYANEISASSPTYLADVVGVLDDGHAVFHCGSHIVAQTVELSDCLRYAEGMRNRIVIWDNLYANDYCPRRLYVGAWTGRETLADVLLNPTGYIETDLLLLDIMALAGDCHGNPTTWEQVLLSHGVPEEFFSVAEYFDLPPFNSDSSTTKPVPTAAMFDALEVLLWRWKTPLSREWYPFLVGLKHDLLIASGKFTPGRLDKTQNPPLAQVLMSSHKPSSPTGGQEPQQS